MTESEATKHRLPHPTLSDGEMTTVDVDGDAILLCRIDGRYHALRDICSHADQALSEGRLRGHTIYCPLHGARFDVRTGECLALPATKSVRSYVVEEDGEGLLVSLSDEEAG
jgi:nitrite reductase/ring-hydroxylating ferredoxin subunit